MPNRKPCSPELRAKLSASLKGRKAPWVSAALKGRQLPANHRAAIAKGMKGRKKSAAHVAASQAGRLASGFVHQVGAERIDKLGYVWVKVAHGQGERGNWKAKHRLVMEAQLGRELDREEHVHHLDDNPGNNHPSNLLLLSHINHSRLNYMLRLLKRGETELLNALLLTLQARQLTTNAVGFEPV